MQARERVMTSEEIYRHIKSDIINLKLAPGAFLSENELAKQYHVSRTPVKAALLRLMTEMFVDIEPQRGTYVTKLDLERIRDIIFMRTTLEQELFISASRTMTGSLLKALKHNLSLQSQLVSGGNFEPHEFYTLDSAFHRTIFEHAGRLKLWEIIQEFQVYYTRFRMLDIIATSSFPQLVKEHASLLTAIEAGDKSAISTQMHTHLNGNLRRLEPRIESELKEYFLPIGN